MKDDSVPDGLEFGRVRWVDGCSGVQMTSTRENESKESGRLQCKEVGKRAFEGRQLFQWRDCRHARTKSLISVPHGSASDMGGVWPVCRCFRKGCNGEAVPRASAPLNGGQFAAVGR